MPKIIEDGQIFDAVMQTIVERGYAGATTKQMAEVANVSEVTLYRRYESKLQLVKLAIEALVEKTDFTAATQYTGDIQADLLRVLRAYQESVVTHGPFFIVLVSEFARNPELAESFRQPLGLFNSIGQMLERYQQEGLLRQEVPIHAIGALLGPLVYLTMIDKAHTGAHLPPLDLQRHVAYFLEGRYSRQGR